MTAPVSRLTAPLSRPRRAAAWTLLLTVGTCLLAAGCSSGGSSGGSSASGTSVNGTSAGGMSAAGIPAPAPAPPGHGGGAKAASSAGSGASAGLAAVPLSGGQSVIFTATLSLRATDIRATVAKATQLAQAAGGYVSGEHASMTRSRHNEAMASIQFKVPAADYQSTLSALSALGATRSETQQAQDVTGTVADVNSRVASAQAAIAQ